MKILQNTTISAPKITGALCLCLFLAVSTAMQSHAQDASFPDLTGRVVDAANILEASAEASLSATLQAHEEQTSNQIVVVTLPSLMGYDIADYANRLGRHWQIGTAENDNGILLVVAPNDRKVRIEVGYGLEGVLPDALASQIVQREILPAFRSGDYTAGIRQGISAIISAIAGEYKISTRTGSSRGTDPISQKLGNFLPLIFIAMVGIPELLKRKGMRKAANGAFPAGFSGLFGTLATGSLIIGLIAAIVVFLLIYFKGSNDGGGGPGKPGGRLRHGGYIGGAGGFGGGGGGFSGGGGSFGGGGASGSW